MVRTLARACAVVVRAVRSPADVAVMIAIGCFIVRVRDELSRDSLMPFVRSLRDAPRPGSRDLASAHARVKRLRDACLSLPGLWRRDTCYVRALTLYRFLDPARHDVRLHLGVEPPRHPEDRLHGHAWVTADGAVLEGPDDAILERVREIPLDVAP